MSLMPSGKAKLRNGQALESPNHLFSSLKERSMVWILQLNATPLTRVISRVLTKVLRLQARLITPKTIQSTGQEPKSVLKYCAQHR